MILSYFDLYIYIHNYSHMQYIPEVSRHVLSTSQVKGAAGQNCDSTCASRSGCSEEAWPKSEEEFKVRAAGRALAVYFLGRNEWNIISWSNLISIGI